MIFNVGNYISSLFLFAQYTSLTPDSKSIYVTAPIKFISHSQLETIVEFLHNEVIYIESEFVKKVMKEHERYQDNFEVYIQTLISQALDSNFLMEIFQEQGNFYCFSFCIDYV